MSKDRRVAQNAQPHSTETSRFVFIFMSQGPSEKALWQGYGEKL